MEFDSIIPADDVCMAIGLVCLSQRRSLRHYLLPDGGELTVNTARNEWAIKNPDSFGSASDFARKYDIADGDDFSRAMQMVENYIRSVKICHRNFHTLLSAALFGILQIPAIQKIPLSDV